MFTWVALPILRDRRKRQTQNYQKTFLPICCKPWWLQNSCASFKNKWLFVKLQLSNLWCTFEGTAKVGWFLIFLEFAYGDHEIWWRWRPLKKSITTLLKWKPGMLMEDSFGLSWSSYLLAVLSVPNHVCTGKSLSKFYESAASRCLQNHHSNQLNSPRCH